MSKSSHKIGKESESKIVRLLQTRNLPKSIIGPFLVTKHSDSDDQKGIDIWVGTIIGFIPLQIKTSRSHGGKKSRRRHFYSEKGIGYITIKSQKGFVKNDDILFYEVVEEINKIINHRIMKKHCKNSTDVIEYI